MYHQFIHETSSELNHKLRKLIEKFQNEDSNLNKKQNLLLDLPNMENQLIVEHCIHNDRFNSIVVFLSNNKVVRCSLKNNQVYQLRGLQYLDVSDIRRIKTLQIGHQQKYLLLTADSLLILRLDIEQVNQQGQTDSINEQYQNNQNTHIYEKHKAEQQVEHLIVECQIEGKVFCDLIQYDKSDNLIDKQDNQKQTIHKFTQRQIFIVECPSDNCQKSTTYEQFINVFSKAPNSSNFNLMIFKLSLCLQKDSCSQTIKLSPLQFCNKQPCIQLALCDVQIPSANNSPQLNPIQVTESNFKYVKSHPLIDVDSTCSNAQYRFYFATQSITEQFQDNQNRHKVFQYEVRIQNEENIIENTVEKGQVKGKLENNCVQFTSHVFQYPQRSVICPSHVYCFPPSAKTSILKYIKILQHHNYPQNIQSEDSPQTLDRHGQCYVQKRIQITTICSKIDNTIQLQQIKLSNKNFKFNFYLDDQHVTFKCNIHENVVLRQVLLIDMKKKVMIVLGNHQAHRINVDGKLNTKKQKINENSNVNGESGQMKIFVISLEENLTLLGEKGFKQVQQLLTFINNNKQNNKISRIVCSFGLESSNDFNYFQPILIGNCFKNSDRKRLMLLPNFICLSMACSSRLRKKITQKIIPQEDFGIISQILVIPKQELYGSMLTQILQKYSSTQGKQINSKQKNIEIIQKEQFIRSVLRVLQ